MGDALDDGGADGQTFWVAACSVVRRRGPTSRNVAGESGEEEGSGRRGGSPLTPPRFPWKIANAANWVSGSVRILKRGEKGDQYADVDGAFGFAARLDNTERAQTTFDKNLDDMSKHLGK